MSMINIQNLTFAYDGSYENVFEDVNLRLDTDWKLGFTGRNGRDRGGSTGMGLYLCKRLADALAIGLQMQSAEGMGTCVTLTFPAESNLTNM